jgi:hypothetical protein
LAAARAVAEDFRQSGKYSRLWMLLKSLGREAAPAEENRRRMTAAARKEGLIDTT